LENRSNFIKKLIYRSKYTGTRETDILLGDFADNYINKLNDAELLAYQKLLDSGDPVYGVYLLILNQLNLNKKNLLLK